MRPEERFPGARRRMVAQQLRARDITDERVLEAMERVPRERFVGVGERERAYDDAALPIARGQTISQPYMVARIAEALQLQGRERVLDVGTGSGYQAAVLAEQARENLREAGYGQVDVVVGDGTLGVPARAPFDAIAVAAAAPGLPEALYEQLQPLGRLVVPVGAAGGQRLEVAIRTGEGPAVLRSVPCRFVPLIGEGGFF